MESEDKVPKIVDPLRFLVFRLGRFSSFTEGGLIRPNAERYKNMFGEVLKVGSAFHPKDYRGRDVRVGDMIVFKNWDEIIALPKEYGRNLFFCPFDHIIGWIIGEEGVTKKDER